MDTVERAPTQPQARSLVSQILEDGFFAGVLGAAVVALWYLVLDTIAGRPLYTPSLLGSLLFQSSTNAAHITVQPAIVAWYTAVHFLAFLGIGMIASWLAAQFEKFPAVGIAMLFLFVLFETAFFIFAFAVGRSVLGTLGLWTVAVANLLAAAAMALYLHYRHPSAVRNMERIWREQE
jgi:hypothetical protein